MDANSLGRAFRIKQFDDYRSAGLSPEHFSQLGSIHMHVDGGGDYGLVQDLLKSLEPEAALGKLNTVIASVAGPQRDKLRDTYASHTPGAKDTEQFDYFATIALADQREAVSRLRSILTRLQNTHDVVIEVEQVVARMDGHGLLSWLPGPHQVPIASDDVGYEQEPTLRFEIHHGFDIPKDQGMSLEALLQKSTQLGVIVGGWFCFSRRGQLSYRSNSFCDESVETVAISEHGLLNQFLTETGVAGELRTVVERVLGIWRTPTRTIGL